MEFQNEVTYEDMVEFTNATMFPKPTQKAMRKNPQRFFALYGVAVVVLVALANSLVRRGATPGLFAVVLPFALGILLGVVLYWALILRGTYKRHGQNLLKHPGPARVCFNGLGVRCTPLDGTADTFLGWSRVQSVLVSETVISVVSDGGIGIVFGRRFVAALEPELLHMCAQNLGRDAVKILY